MIRIFPLSRLRRRLNSDSSQHSEWPLAKAASHAHLRRGEQAVRCRCILHAAQHAGEHQHYCLNARDFHVLRFPRAKQIRSLNDFDCSMNDIAIQCGEFKAFPSGELRQIMISHFLTPGGFGLERRQIGRDKFGGMLC